MNIKTNISRNTSFDIMKFFACLGVVTIHCFYQIQPDIYNLLAPLIYCSVPVFFMITGYFLGSGDNKLIYNQIRKIGRLILFTFIIYTLFNLWKDGLQSLNWLKDSSAWISFLFFNETPWNTILWYFPAIVYVFVLNIFLFKKMSSRSLMVIMFLVFTIALVINYMKTFILFPPDWLSKIKFTNFIFQGIPFFLLGFLMKEYINITRKLSWLLLFIAIIGYSVYIFLYYSYGIIFKNYSIISILIVVSVFSFAKHSPISTRNPLSKVLSLIGRKYSADIYIWHILCLYLLPGILNKVGISYLFFDYPVISLFLFTLLFSMIFHPVLKRMNIF